MESNTIGFVLNQIEELKSMHEGEQNAKRECQQQREEIQKELSRERDEVQAQVMKLKGVSDSIIQANKEITKCNFELAQLQESVSELEHDNKLFGSDIETLLAKSKQISEILNERNEETRLAKEEETRQLEKAKEFQDRVKLEQECETLLAQERDLQQQVSTWEQAEADLIELQDTLATLKESNERRADQLVMKRAYLVAQCESAAQKWRTLTQRSETIAMAHEDLCATRIASCEHCELVDATETLITSLQHPSTPSNNANNNTTNKTS